MLQKLGSVADECDGCGVPLLAMMYPRGAKIPSEHDPEAVALAARLGAELGADIIKTNYTGDIETFRKVTDGCPVPVIIAGGPKAKTDTDVLRMVSDAMAAGGVGVSIGRNVFQNDNPSAMTRALSAIVHRGAGPNEALRILGVKD
jgi:fructose-bisphosphate aldolase/2-amino-3,7-dideoxy-D-threo-hept-6-ulosonate synthase